MPGHESHAKHIPQKMGWIHSTLIGGNDNYVRQVTCIRNKSLACNKCVNGISIINGKGIIPSYYRSVSHKNRH